MEKHLKILITNDDGIDSAGLAILCKWASKLGDVTVSAPATQQSGKSHAITLRAPIDIKQTPLNLGETSAYAVGSTPVDCVRFATIGLGQRYDLVLSGINRGYNLGEDILYSGTVGAIFEAQLQKMHGIAFSTEFTTFEHAEKALDSVWEFVVANSLLDKNLAYNVNIPPEPKGIVVTKQGGPYFSDRWVQSEDGTYQQCGYCVHDNRHDHSLDTDATIDGYVTVTPLTVDRSKVISKK